MDSTEKVEVCAPKFELYQSVILYWNGEERPTRVVRRWSDLDDPAGGYWWYKLTNDEQTLPQTSN